MAEFITGETEQPVKTTEPPHPTTQNLENVSTDAEIGEKDTILTVLDMAANMAERLEEILEQLRSST